ncbi:MAG TPA: HEAT repeat domain-containing protein [Burkholderiaceae bacterium]|nr:HEAT repeat domain-containing protein [Burkholderiaceae bacterium]
MRRHSCCPPALLACALLVGSLLVGACAARPAPSKVAEPAPDQYARLRAAEQLYRKDDPAFAAERDDLARDPVTAFWLTRLFVRDLMLAREGRETGRDYARVQFNDVDSATRVRTQTGDSDPLLRAAAGIKNPVEARALAQIDALGAAAAPCIVHDLGCHPQAFVRELGVELLARIGRPALPAMEPLRASAREAERCVYVEALGGMPPDAASTALLSAFVADDSEFTVRATAARALGRAGADAAPRLRQTLATDPDPFVRRTAAEALAAQRDAETAAALVGYLERCQQEHDRDGEATAQRALQTLSRTRTPRTPAAWRAWSQSLGFAGGR